MRLDRVASTFICQLNKPENRAKLEAYRNRRDGSAAEFVRYYLDVFSMLENTPAWNVRGVNKMLNELTAKVRATINHEKQGKSSAYAHAGMLLNKIDQMGWLEAEPRNYGHIALAPKISMDELQAVLAA